MLCSTRDLPRPGIQLVSPASAGGFLSTVPPGKSSVYFFFSFSWNLGLSRCSRDMVATGLYEAAGRVACGIPVVLEVSRALGQGSSCRQLPAFLFLIASEVKVAQSCPTLCDPMDCIVHGILQAKILEWVAYPFSRGSSQPRNRTQVSRIAGGFFTS